MLFQKDNIFQAKNYENKKEVFILLGFYRI